MKLNIQFFAEEDDTELTPLEAIKKIMESMENMEDFTEEFDIIKTAISDKVTATEESDYVPKEKYDNLKSAYIKRFGEMTEHHVEVNMAEEETQESIYNIDFTKSMFDGSTE